MSENLKTGRKISTKMDASMPETYEDETISAEEVARRVAKLADIRRELESVVVAVKALEFDAKEKQKQHEALKQTLSQLQADAKSAEAILQLPEGSFVRLFERAGRKGRIRGMLEGLLIGFASSLLAWYVITQVFKL